MKEFTKATLHRHTSTTLTTRVEVVTRETYTPDETARVGVPAFRQHLPEWTWLPRNAADMLLGSVFQNFGHTTDQTEWTGLPWQHSM